MLREERLHQLIDLIYEAAIRPSVWADVVAALAEAFDGAGVMLGVGIADDRLDPNYCSGVLPEFADRYTENMVNGLPWRAEYSRGYVHRFGTLAEVFSEVDLAESAFFRDWLEPQGFAPEWPIGHTIVTDGGQAIGGIGLFRRAKADQGPFTKEHLALGDRLVRHLARAFVVHATLGGVRRERLAMAEVMDRLPTGVILLDASRRAVVTNQSADRIIAQQDGFRIDAGGPCLSQARENARLQQIVADVLDSKPGREFEKTGFLAVTRPSGKRPYALMITPLMAPPLGSQVREAVATIFISDPETGLPSATEVLETIYSLTHSEAELVRLLSQGLSLEEAARARGVSINTARSHLKRVFSKTDTRRQGELVRLVLTGVASLADD